MRPANERQCYIVTLSLIGWAQTLNDPCCLKQSCESSFTDRLTSDSDCGDNGPSTIRNMWRHVYKVWFYKPSSHLLLELCLWLLLLRCLSLSLDEDECLSLDELWCFEEEDELCLSFELLLLVLGSPSSTPLLMPFCSGAASPFTASRKQDNQQSCKVGWMYRILVISHYSAYHLTTHSSPLKVSYVHHGVISLIILYFSSYTAQYWSSLCEVLGMY